MRDTGDLAGPDRAVVEALRNARPTEQLRLPSPADISARARARAGRRRAAGLALAACLAAGLLAAAVPGDTTGRPETLDVASAAAPTPAVKGPVVDGQAALACGLGPLSVLAAPPGAERADTPAAAALRRALTDRTPGLRASVDDGWVLIADTGDSVTFGVRRGPVGIGQTVTLERRGDTFEYAGSGGCGPLGFGHGRQAVDVENYAERSGELLLQWTGTTCDGSRAPELQVVESEQSISVLVVAYAAPADCALVGVRREMTAQLARPVGDRVVENAGYVPARRVPRA